MLCYLINQLTPAEAAKLITRLWNSPWPAGSPNHVSAKVELQSTDLVVSFDGTAKFIAEMKLKSLLHGNQEQAFARNFPRAEATILGLFDTAIYRSFPKLLVSHFADGAALEKLEGDAGALMRLWIGYLAHLQEVVLAFERIQYGAVSDSLVVRKLLREAKLEGIFEAWRHWLLVQLINTQSDTFEVQEANTHGRHLTNWVRTRSDFEFGFQWQTEAIKLFVSVPKGASKDQRLIRDQMLETLVGRYSDKFGKEDRFSPSHGQWFSSVTVLRADCWQDLNQIASELSPRLEFLETCTLD